MKSRNEPSRPATRREAGTATVEFAIAALVFFIIVLGTMAFGVAVWEYNIVASAAKDGARWAAVRGATSSTPATSTTVESYVNARVYGRTVTVTTTWPDGGSPSNGKGKRVRVVVSTTFIPTVRFLSSMTLRSTAEMIIMR